MHRSNFRPKTKLRQESKPLGSPKELEAIREQIENVSKNLSPLATSVERLSAPKPEIPTNLSDALVAIQARLDRLEHSLVDSAQEARKMAATLSKAILKMADMVEAINSHIDARQGAIEKQTKQQGSALSHAVIEMADKVEQISKGEGSALKDLLNLLQNRKFRIIRNAEGDMTAVEAE